MEKIYLVVSGSYSDYHEVAAFTSREKAEMMISRHPKTLYDVEIKEMVLDIEIPEIPEGWSMFRVYFDENNSNARAHPEHNALDTNPGKWVSGYWVPSVVAENELDAIKIASEKLAQWKAMEGITRPYESKS